MHSSIHATENLLFIALLRPIARMIGCAISLDLET